MYGNKFCHGKSRKHCEKRRKCWLPAFSDFPTMFSKGFVVGLVISRDFLGKELLCINATINAVWFTYYCTCSVYLTHSHTMIPFDPSGKQAF